MQAQGLVRGCEPCAVKQDYYRSPKIGGKEDWSDINIG